MSTGPDSHVPAMAWLDPAAGAAPVDGEDGRLDAGERRSVADRRCHRARSRRGGPRSRRGVVSVPHRVVASSSRPSTPVDAGREGRWNVRVALRRSCPCLRARAGQALPLASGTTIGEWQETRKTSMRRQDRQSSSGVGRGRVWAAAAPCGAMLGPTWPDAAHADDAGVARVELLRSEMGGTSSVTLVLAESSGGWVVAAKDHGHEATPDAAPVAD